MMLNERSYIFYDPTYFTNIVLKDLEKWATLSTYKGFQSNNIAYQDHYLRNAEIQLENLSSLINISREDEILKQESYINTLSRVSAFYSLYIKNKKTIPSNSHWFKQKPVFPSWYLTDQIQTNLATTTGTTLIPKIECDPNWIERLLINYEIKGLEDYLAQNNNEAVIRILNNLNIIFSFISNDWNISFCINENIKILNVIQTHINKQNPKPLPYIKPEELGIIDYLGLLPVTLLVELRKSVLSWNTNKIFNATEINKWKDLNFLYRLNIPSILLNDFEDFQKQLINEIKIEGKIVTANWYAKQYVSHVIIKLIISQLGSLLNIANDVYFTSEDWISKKHFTYSAALITRGLEFYIKFLHFMDIFDDYIFKLKEEIHSTYPEIDNYNKEIIIEKINKKIEKLYVLHAKCSPGISKGKRLDDIPDFFGQIIFNTGEQCFDALINNNFELFQKLFHYYYEGIFDELNHIMSETSDWNSTIANRVIIQPLGDLCNLSGYCYFFSELYSDNRIWNYCVKIWDDYFNNGNKRNKLEFIRSILSYKKDNLIQIYNHTKWFQKIRKLLYGMPRITKKIDVNSIIPHYRSTVNHHSKIVQLFGGSDKENIFPTYDGLDVFIEFYLKNIPEAKNINFGRESGLSMALERID